MSYRRNLLPLIAAGCVSINAFADLKEGDFAGKIGGAYIMPSDASVKVEGVPDQDGKIQGHKLDTKRDESAISVNIEALYMVTDNIAVNIGTFWPSEIKSKLGGSDSAKFKYKVWPSYIAAQFYLNDPGEEFRPYVGAGVHYTKVSDVQTDNGAFGKSDMDGSFGLLGQVGGIYNINETMFVDFSARYMMMEAEGKLDYQFTGTGNKKYSGKGKVKDFKIDPWVFNVSFGVKF
ncbi:hypothetical protein EOPP23_10650 [Endozoicomonas sp. OPT23]|uniref:OmpW/AlkL family protein n=1 Tax=Endozoicomonas sp. OPT23 TaxID=2072845 RepID=UPI00129AC503|nr:OmpW family outer membrane protein [Endozoicomonas sp. OPT23]MRI33444.1 hypothetical protein [Endozoicomonas sp. OPT23]